MIYSIEAELLSENYEHSLGITIVSGNNLNLFTSVPKKNGHIIAFNEKDEMRISYFFGEFHYNFQVEFKAFLEEEGLYKFIINEVSIEKNFRKEKRENVELNALILDAKSMYYGKILDLSEQGMKIETDRPIFKKKIEVYFAENNGNPSKRKGKIVWSKEGKEYFYYGIKLK